ncbi:DUF6364 family protein [Aequorivita lipolytica]|jgi:hypothetical protein|uniref:Antitoxin n=1 Tax=Aequorivita lipolytica TaxID=153267 RepID=A0A5C6YSB6_9FLAO|nr:DUF6364 family protein [Aequorivita lipolytica]TXD70298.1 hypothetical protein ESV24_03800 [Aequorivita lipolytica]SRX50726.1 hypothetical protein AEQU2_01202 [Aequorivita lipolytica]
MNTKLTLTIEQEVIEKAKAYAKGKGRSLSDLVENYFKTITASNQPDYKVHGSIAASLLGSFQEPENFDYKKELENAIAEKHLKNG